MDPSGHPESAQYDFLHAVKEPGKGEERGLLPRVVEGLSGCKGEYLQVEGELPAHN